MPDYAFHKTAVHDQVGGVVRVARNARITVTDPTTGVVAAGLTQNGQPVPWVTTDSKGSADWSASIPEVRITAPNGLNDVVTSSTAIQSTATAVATSTATSVATDVASGIATAITRADSHVLLDTDGVPYVDLAAAGTQVMQLDTDGVPYFI